LRHSDLPLKISQGKEAPFIGISVGTFDDSFTGLFPLLAISNNSGNNWSYPHTINNNSPITIDPAATSGILEGASCSGSVNKSVCIGVGQWRTEEGGTYPLVALGIRNGTEWTYPKSIFTNPSRSN
jgi:hypothetical protein